MTKVAFLIHALLLPLLAAGSVPGGGNEGISFRRISLDQGLSQSLVLCMLQDRHGFMWFGTEDGLNMYDGYEFRIFRHDPLDTNSLSGNNIWSLYEDREGYLWIGTWGSGLNRYDPVRQRFTRYIHAAGDSTTISSDRVVSMVEDLQGVLWVSTADGGLNRLDRQSGRYVRVTANEEERDGPPTNALFGMLLDQRGFIWIGTYDSGLLRLNPNTLAFRQYRHDPRDDASLSDNRVLALCGGDDGSLWVGTWGGGLNSFDPETDTFRRFQHNPRNPTSLGNDIVRALHRDRAGNLWVGTFGGGLSRLDRSTGHFTTYRHSPVDGSTLSDDVVVSIYEDSGDVLWFGTGNGISVYSPHGRKFARYSHRPGDSTSLSGSAVFAMCRDSTGMVWVGTKDGGLNRFDPVTANVIRYRHDPNDPASLSSDYVSALMASADGGLWVGTWGGGVNVMRPGSSRFQRFRAESRDEVVMPNDYVSCLAEDEEGTIWIGFWTSGLVSWNPARDVFEHHVHDPNDLTSLSDNEVRSTYVDRTGQLWVGTVRGGLNRFDALERSFSRVGQGSEASSESGAMYVQAILEDRQGDLWIGTFGGGLLRLDPEAGSFTRYTRRNGLPNDVVYGILEDRQGHLWLSTNHGLCQFDPAHGVLRNFDKSDGLQSNEFNYNAYCSGRGGELYFGGINGFNVIDPEGIDIHLHAPPVQVTSFKIFDRPLASAVAPFALDTIVLSHDENFFSFEFAALDYTSPPDNQYAYKLDGVDYDWVRSGNRRYAAYTDIDPGTYRFRVIGSNNDGIWNEHGADVLILITPPFWARWWFRTLMVLVMIGLATVAYRLRVARLLEMERMRLRIASDLHDDIGSNLGSIAFMADLARQRLGEESSESQQLRTISRVARVTADALREIVWIINPEHDKLENLALKLREVAGNTLAGLNFSFSVAEQDSTLHLSMEVRRQVILAYKEMLTNVARHAGATNVKIGMSMKKDELCVQVADDGSGFEPGQGRTGHGLMSLRRRAESLGGSFQIKTELGRGTTATFRAKIP